LDLVVAAQGFLCVVTETSLAQFGVALLFVTETGTAFGFAIVFFTVAAAFADGATGLAETLGQAKASFAAGAAFAVDINRILINEVVAAGRDTGGVFSV
jgi:hypothetical protein